MAVKQDKARSGAMTACGKAQGWLSLGARRRKRGLATVELAIVLPLLLWLSFGIIEYGWLFIKHQQLTNACRHCARIAVLADTTNAQYQQAVTEAMSVAGFSDISYTVTPENLPENLTTGEEFTIQITVPYKDGITLGMPLVPKPATIGQSMTMLKEGT